MSSDAAEQANQQMVDRLIACGSLWTPSLVAAFRSTLRHRFIPRVYLYSARNGGRWRKLIPGDLRPEVLRILYDDRALVTHISDPEGKGRAWPISSSSQPSLMALMLEDLDLQPGARVLEIGTGTGYNAALMAYAVGAGLVTSIDVNQAVLEEAQAHLAPYAGRGVHFHHADGREGYPDRAPFDRLMVTAATPDLEPAWLDQLRSGGRLVAPVNFAPGLSYTASGVVDDGVFHGRLCRGVSFMPLRGETEAGREESAAVPPARSLSRYPAPWADWFDRRQRPPSVSDLLAAVALFGHLQGLIVENGTLPDEEYAYGLVAPQTNQCCWLTSRSWFALDSGGRELGRALWHDFLAAGGPWPTDYVFRAAPLASRLPPLPEGGMRTAGRRCQHQWEIPPNRYR